MASRALKIDPAKSEERSVTSESVQAAVSDNIEREIAILAYQFWQERGSPIGSDQEDWFRAEREIARSTRKDEEVDEEEVGSPNSAEQSMAHAEETDSTMLRFPVRSEVIQASKRTTHGFR